MLAQGSPAIVKEEALVANRGISRIMPLRVFESENEAAEFIAGIKIQDPQDEFVYVISADPSKSGKFIIDIYEPDGPISRESLTKA